MAIETGSSNTRELIGMIGFRETEDGLRMQNSYDLRRKFLILALIASVILAWLLTSNPLADFALLTLFLVLSLGLWWITGLYINTFSPAARSLENYVGEITEQIKEKYQFQNSFVIEEEDDWEDNGMLAEEFKGTFIGPLIYLHSNDGLMRINVACGRTQSFARQDIAKLELLESDKGNTTIVIHSKLKDQSVWQINFFQDLDIAKAVMESLS